MSNCKVCNKETNIVFNINWKKTSICNNCANAITLQQIQDLITHKR